MQGEYEFEVKECPVCRQPVEKKVCIMRCRCCYHEACIKQKGYCCECKMKPLDVIAMDVQLESLETFATLLGKVEGMELLK